MSFERTLPGDSDLLRRRLHVVEEVGAEFEVGAVEVLGERRGSLSR